MNAQCLHSLVDFVELIITAPDGTRRRGSNAVACRSCPDVWTFANPEDLPHWLYERLKARGQLPMPQLTPEIIGSLKRLAEQQEEHHGD